MEHSKLITLSLKCNKCSRTWSVSKDDFQKPIIVCQDPECKSEFTVYEGLRNGLKMENDFIPTPFLANDMFQDIVDVKIGYLKDLVLPDTITKIFKINLFPLGSFHAGAVEIDKHSYRLMTSLFDESEPTMFGVDSKVMVMVHAKTGNHDTPWLHMLAYALEQYQSDDYVTCVLLSEIALETYVDVTIAAGYREIGLDEDSIARLLKSNVPDKVNALMRNLYGIRLADNKGLFRTWERDVLLWRNDIAHGRKSVATKEEGKIAYDTVVDAIFHLIEGVDNHYKKKQSDGHQ